MRVVSCIHADVEPAKRLAQHPIEKPRSPRPHGVGFVATQNHHKQRTTLLRVLHDINHAARDCNTLLAVRQGQITAHGPTATVLTPSCLNHVFNVQTHILHPPQVHYPICLFDRPSR